MCCHLTNFSYKWNSPGWGHAMDVSTKGEYVGGVGTVGRPDRVSLHEINMTEFEILATIAIFLLSLIALLQLRILQLQKVSGKLPDAMNAAVSTPSDSTMRSEKAATTPAPSTEKNDPKQRKPKRTNSFHFLPDIGGHRKKREHAEAERMLAEARLARLTPASGSNRSGSDLANLQNTPGFRQASVMLTEAMERYSEIMAIDFRRDVVTIRHLVDGVWHRGRTWDPQLAGQAVVALKNLAGADPNGRASRQTGRFRATQGGTTCEATMASQRGTAGEKVAIRFARPVPFFESMEDLGIKKQSQQLLRDVLRDGSGIILLSGASGSGVRTTTEVFVKSIDRLTRDVLSIEEENGRYPQLEAIDVRTYSAAQGQDPTHVLRWIYDLNPDTVLLRELVNAETVDLLCECLAKHSRLAICTVRAQSAVEALLRIVTLGGDRKRFADRLACVVNQKLIRKLCNECKERYVPDAKTAQELGFGADAHLKLCRPPSSPEAPCTMCGGLGYKGSTGAFEVLRPTDDFRKLLAGTPRLEVVRQAALRTGMRTARQDAMDHVFRGITSLDELARVMGTKSQKKPMAMASR